MLSGFLEQGVLLCMRWVERYPWLFALLGFASGLASYLLVERSPELAQVLALLMLFSWVWLILENFLKRGAWHVFGINVPRPVFRFVAQMVHQESLFFVIPFFLTTTTWSSGQLLFTSVLLVAALVSILDPLYYGWLARKRWLYFLFHGLTLFALLLTALPMIFQLPTTESYLWALVIAGLVSLPSVTSDLPEQWRQHSGAVMLLVVATAGIGWWARPWVPPATLWLTEVAITDHVDDARRNPDMSITRIDSSNLANGLYAFTAIHAPRGLDERIYHVWYRNDEELDRIALDITGGREEGYRAWTHKLNFPDPLSGEWKIRVVTAADQLIGEIGFQVSDAGGSIESITQRVQQPMELSAQLSPARHSQEAAVSAPWAGL
ncbi:MAG TPA: DUF5924 family protein [Xanthomonadales bacterium]|nr:DUF5924 family protein [Xanthomonadales bacterium]